MISHAIKSLFPKSIMASATPKHVPIPRRGVDYRGKIVLAPMVRSGECPSRLLALKYGADLVWGPETIDKSLIGTTRRLNPTTNTVDFTRHSSNGAPKTTGPDPNQRESVIFRLHPEKEGKQLIYQMGTSNPDTAVKAGTVIAPDVAGIDVNAGCPKPFSTSGGMGAALLKTPDLLCSILVALVEHVGVPHEIGISVKIRILETEAETEALVTRLCATGITGLTVHCRTTPMRPRERAIREQLRTVARVCREAGVACVMNGDVYSRDEALGLITEYECDGAMIATAAETNSSVFRPTAEGGKEDWKVMVREYVRIALDVENRWGNTKYLLGNMIPGKDPMYNLMTRTKSYVELVQALGYVEEMGELAKQVDEALEIGSFVKPKMTKAERKAALKAAANAEEKPVAVDRSVEHSNKRKIDEDEDNSVKKAKADDALLDMPVDVAREMGPGSVQGQASVLAV